MKLLDGYYTPRQGGLATMYFSRDKYMPAYFKIRTAKKWAYVYYKRKRVWDCNLIFFKAHFQKVK